MNRRLLTVPEAAAELAMSRSTAYLEIRAGRLRAVRRSETSPWRVPVEALDEYVQLLDSNQDRRIRAVS